MTELDINAGVGEVAVTMPAQGETRAIINGGVGETRVRIPAGVAARIQATRGVGDLTVAGRFIRQGDTLYVSSDYETNPNRINLTISGGVGSILIE